MVGPVRKILVAALVASIAQTEGFSGVYEEGGEDLPTDAEGFVAIFNGKDLAGWEGLPEYWTVKDGAISGHEGEAASKQTFLVFARAETRDFELRLKYKFTTPRGNSGIQFRSRVLDSAKWVVGGYQADMDAEGNLDGSIYDEAGVAGNRGPMSQQGKRTIWLEGNVRREEPLAEDAGDLKKAIKVGDWNELSLTVNGNHIVYAINNHVMTELIDDSRRAPREGVLALQLHQGFTMEVLFKDIKVRPVHEKDPH